MMQRPFGHTFNISLSPARSWLNAGPGWAMLAGTLSGGTFRGLLPLLGLWLVVDPLLGTLWDISVRQGVWRKIAAANLPSPPGRGFYLPYARPDAPGGRLVLSWRQYGLWWREQYWPEYRAKLVTFGLALGLALLISLALKPLLFWLTLLAVLMTLPGIPDLSASAGGRWQSMAQFLLPWTMGAMLWSQLSPLSLVIGICYWVAYLGGLRMLGRHRRAEILFFGGQGAALIGLLALRLLPGAALLSVLWLTQLLLYTKHNRPADFLPRAQPYLVAALLAAGVSLGWGM